MTQPGPKPLSLFCAGLAIAVFAAQTARGEMLEKTRNVAGATVRYKVVLPDGYDPAIQLIRRSWPSAEVPKP